MDILENSKLKRDNDFIKKHLKEKGTGIYTDIDLSILVYHKFVDRDISILDNVCKIIGIVCVLDESTGKYSVINVPGVVEVTPDEIGVVEVDGVLYHKLVITKGNELISDTTVVKDTGYVYKVFDMLVLKGNVPFFIKPDDMLRIMQNLPKFTGFKLGKDTLAFEFFIALMSRDPKDPTKEYRTTVKTYADIKSRPPMWIGLMNIYYSFGSTISKIAGSYFKTGVLVATVNQNKKETKLEKILKA